MRHTLRIALSELIYYKGLLFLPLALLVYFAFQLTLGSRLDVGSLQFAVPQIIVVGVAIFFAGDFKEKRDLVLACLPVARRSVLAARLVTRGVVWVSLVAAFTIGQWLSVPETTMTLLMIQVAAVSGLTLTAISLWLLLVELNFHSRHNWWKLVVAVLLLAFLLLATALTIDMLYAEDPSLRDSFFQNVIWLLLIEHLLASGLLVVTGVLFLRRASFTGRAASSLMERSVQNN